MGNNCKPGSESRNPIGKILSDGEAKNETAQSRKKPTGDPEQNKEKIRMIKKNLHR
jgi:hypothetical protein